MRLRSWGTLHSDSVAAMTHRVNRPPSTHRELHCKNQALLNSESVTESMRQRFVSGCRINPPPLAPPRGGEVLTAGRAREPDAAKLCLARSRQRANEFVRVKSSLCPATPALDPAQFTHVKFKRGKNRVSVFYGWHLRHIFHGNKAARLGTHLRDISDRLKSTNTAFILTFESTSLDDSVPSYEVHVRRVVDRCRPWRVRDSRLVDGGHALLHWAGVGRARTVNIGTNSTAGSFSRAAIISPQSPNHRRYGLPL